MRTIDLAKCVFLIFRSVGAGILIVFVIGFYPSSAHSLEVVHDSGNTHSAARFYRNIQNLPTDKPVNVKLPTADAKPVSLARHFPLVTTMSPGTPSQRSVEQIAFPLFIIGMDQASLSWLEQNLAQLKSMGARGVVVSGTDYQAFRQLKMLVNGQGMLIDIGPGDAIAEQYGIKTYPVVLQ